MKKIILILTAALLLTSLITFAQRQQIGTSNTYWEVRNDTLYITGSGDMPDLNYNSSPWFSIQSGLHYLELGDSITAIGHSTFSYCTGLTSVNIGNSITSIGNYAFSNCTGLTSVTIPNSVTSIGIGIFNTCSDLTSIQVDATNSWYSSLDGILYNKLQDTLICCPEGKTDSVTIPNSVTSIGDGAFQNCIRLTSVTIPNSVTSIGNAAFSACSGLTSIILPVGLTSIEGSVFGNCHELASVSIPNTVTTIGNSAFYNCYKLASITIPNSIISIGDYTFWGCSSLTSVTIPNSVTSIGYRAFLSCSELTSIEVDVNNTVFASEDGVLFNKTKNKLLVFPVGKDGIYTIPNSVTSIEEFAFASCSKLTSVTFSTELTMIGDYAFSNCTGLSSVVLPTNLDSIGDNAFSYCSGLTSITIPNTVTTIGEWAFSNCSNLKEIINLNPIPISINHNVFGVKRYTCKLRVPKASASLYRQAPIWQDFLIGDYKVNVATDNSNYGNVSGSGFYFADDTVTLTAIPNVGCQFVQWNDADTNNPRIITLTQDTVFTAEFIIADTIAYSNSLRSPNINFSLGNFTYWNAYVGTIYNNEANINQTGIIPGRHSIMVARQLLMAGQLHDERCPKIKKVPEGFAYAAKIGNENAGAEMAAIEYTMTVGSNNSLLLVHYAWVMEYNNDGIDGNHSAEEQPRFSIIIKDDNGVPIDMPCGTIEHISSPDLENLACVGNVLGQDWTTVGYSLEHLIGRTIKIYFETRDCTLSGHYGYAYVVAECRPMRIEVQCCEGETAARFFAPYGFKTYTWTRSSNPEWIVTGEGRDHQIITLSDPLDDEIITCEVESTLNSECFATVNTVVKRTIIDARFSYGVMENDGVNFAGHNNQNWYDTCSRTATFVDRSTITNSKQAEGGRIWEIHGLNVSSIDSMWTYTFPDPGLEGLDSVRYLVRLTIYAENGCMDTSKTIANHYITIYASPRVEIEGVTQMCQGDTKTLTVKTIRSQFNDYYWTWFDANGIEYHSIDTFINITYPGTYYIEATDIEGCTVRDTHVVTHLRADLNIVNIQTPSCYGDKDGYFSHGVITGGTAPYQYFAWTLLDMDGNPYIDSNSNENGKTYTNLVAGIYTFEAIDAEGCIVEGEVEIFQPEPLEIYKNIYSVYNNDISIYAVGGTAPYSYSIAKDDGSVTIHSDSASELSAGTYFISVTDANGCLASDTIVIEKVGAIISGSVIAVNNPTLVSGTVYLYQENQNTMRYWLVDSVSIQDGAYLFTEITEGNYLLKAVASNISNAVPTYYGNTENWIWATTISIQDTLSLINKDIEIIVLESLNGNSQISGYVGEDDKGTKSIHKSGVDNPSVGVTVLLKIKESLETISRTQTDEDGYFEFKNIPVGNYIIVLDIPGLGMVDYHEVEITEDGQTIEDLNYTVTEDGIKTENASNCIKQIFSNEALSIYPNPTQNILHIQSSSSIQQINIYDISGRIVGADLRVCPETTTIDVSYLANGIYLIKVKTEEGEVVRKIVKQ